MHSRLHTTPVAAPSPLNSFTTLGCLLITSAVTGASYTFSIYSAALKEKFALSESEINTISIASFVSGFMTFLTGLISDRMGPRRSITFGGTIQGATFLTFWLISTDRIPLMGLDTTKLTLIFSCVAVLNFLGSSFIVAQVYCSVVRNFPDQRGLTTGLLKGFVGLCGGAITQIFVGFAHPDMEATEDSSWLGFNLAAAIVVFSATIVPSTFIEIRKTKERSENVRSRVLVCYTILVFMGATVVTSALIEKSAKNQVMFVLSVLIVVFWVSPVCLSMKIFDVEVTTESTASTADSPSLPLLEKDNNTDVRDGDGEFTLIEMVATLDFWLLYICSIILVGGGLTLSSNAGQIFKAIGSSGAPRATTLFSCTQSFARVLGGFACDSLRARKLPRTLVVVAGLGTMILGYGCLVLNTETWLTVGMIVSGVSFGLIWPSMVVIVSEIWGSKHLGSNYMLFDGSCSAVGSLLFSKAITSLFFAEGEENCFRGGFEMILGCACGGLACSILLTARRTKETKR